MGKTTLQEQANEILDQEIISIYDAIELWKISWRMIDEYKKKTQIAVTKEQEYTAYRASMEVWLQKVMTQWRAHVQAKDAAEVKYWDYTSRKAGASVVSMQIKALQTLCSLIQSKDRVEQATIVRSSIQK